MTLDAPPPPAQICYADDISSYMIRRNELVQFIKERFPNTSGLITIFGSVESESCYPIEPDKSLYYLTGVTDPGAVLVMDLDGRSTLYLPGFSKETKFQWTGSALGLEDDDATKLGIDEITDLGKSSCRTLYPYFSREDYSRLLDRFADEKNKEGCIFTLYTIDTDGLHSQPYHLQYSLIQHINSLQPGFNETLVDISSILEMMRKKKDKREIELISKAIKIVKYAQATAAKAIRPNAPECVVQAALEYMITALGARVLTPNIVASGRRGTFLHSWRNVGVMKEGDLVIVDIAPTYEYYCADITRTYPVSGSFTPRQRELYGIVLELQKYIASIARPGYCLNNREQPEQSLTYLARNFLDERCGYAKYMPHSIGHRLGLKPHDVGSLKLPLQEGEVITNEPGIYIPEEGIGIRIEDDYQITKDGTLCLSKEIPKEIDEIEKMVQYTL